MVIQMNVSLAVVLLNPLRQKLASFRSPVGVELLALEDYGI
jgi:hypothetical protein